MIYLLDNNHICLFSSLATALVTPRHQNMGISYIDECGAKMCILAFTFLFRSKLCDKLV